MNRQKGRTMISFFNKKAKAEKLRQEQYRKAYERYQTELNQKYQPLFVTLWLLWLHGGHTTIKKEQINGLDWWAAGQIKVSLSKNNKTLFEIRRTGYDNGNPQCYTLTTFTPDRQEYQDFPVEYAQQLFDFLAYYQFKHKMVKMLEKNGNRVPKTNEYLENLLRYTMLQAGAKPAKNMTKQQNELLLHNLINLKRYSK